MKPCDTKTSPEFLSYDDDYDDDGDGNKDNNKDEHNIVNHNKNNHNKDTRNKDALTKKATIKTTRVNTTVNKVEQKETKLWFKNTKGCKLRLVKPNN